MERRRIHDTLEYFQGRSEKKNGVIIKDNDTAYGA